MSAFPRLAAALPVLLALAACGTGMPFVNAADNEPAIKGTVGYRERVALPDDAMVVVTLVDTTPVIMHSPIVAEAVVRAEGRQIPIAFELTYDRARVVAERNYAVRASIRSGERILFESSGSYPVITRGNPKRVDIELVRAVADLSQAAPTLVGSAWRLEDLAGTGVVDRAESTLEFPEAGRVGGQGGCNRFFGYFETSGASLTIARLGATKKMCPPALMDQEARYLRALEGAERYAIEGTTLRVFSKGLDKPLRFVRR
jgi:putative lipoprotein